MAGENETKEIYEGYEEAKNPAPPYGNCIFAGTMDGENYGFYLPDHGTQFLQSLPKK